MMVDEVYVNPLVRVPLWLSVLVTTTLTAPAAWAAVVAVIEVLFTTVTVLAAVPPTVTVAPDRKPVPVMVTAVPPLPDPELGEISVTVGGGKKPVALSDTVKVGCPGTDVLIVNVADRAPLADGVNVTLMGQLPPGATPVPPVAQLPLEIAKSPALAPLKVRLLTVSGPSPLFDRVAVCGAPVVTTNWFPKTSEEGATPATALAEP